MQITHNNHFVSQFYLKRWANSENKIWCYRTLVSNKNVPEWELKSIKKSAVQMDLYTSLNNDRVESDDFEKWIEVEIESPTQEVIEKAIERKSLNQSDWEKLIKYFALQDLRTPSNYIASKKRWGKELPEILEKTLNETMRKFRRKEFGSPKRNSSSSYKNDYISDCFNVTITPNNNSKEKGEVKAEILSGRSLWLGSQKYLIENTAKILFNHSWSIVECAENYEWFTSDHPVVRLNYYNNDQYDLQGGWGVKNGNLFMPISPKFVLFTEIGKKLPQRFSFNEDITVKLNKYLAERAYRTIFSTKPESNIRDLRPRIVDRRLFENEQSTWKKWNINQSSAEENFRRKNEI